MLHFGYEIRRMRKGDTFITEASMYDATVAQNYAQTIGVSLRMKKISSGVRQFSCEGMRPLTGLSWAEPGQVQSVRRKAIVQAMRRRSEGEKMYANACGFSVPQIRDIAKHVLTGTHSRYTVNPYRMRKGWVYVKRLMDHPTEHDALPFD